MKKAYINPDMEIIKIATQQILAASTLGMDGSVEINDESKLLGRQYDWDEE